MKTLRDVKKRQIEKREREIKVSRDGIIETTYSALLQMSKVETAPDDKEYWG